MSNINRIELLTKVKDIVSGIVPKCQDQSFSSESSFSSLGFDEFDFIELVMLVEEAFDVIVEDHLFTIDSTVNSLITHILEQADKE